MFCIILVHLFFFGFFILNITFHFLIKGAIMDLTCAFVEFYFCLDNDFNFLKLLHTAACILSYTGY